MDIAARQQFLQDSFQKLRLDGIVKTKQDFAEYVGINRVNVSRAFNGDPRYCTDSAISKVQFAIAQLEKQSSDDSRSDMVLVIPTGARGGTIGDFTDSVMEKDCERIVSPIKGAQYAIQVTGDSMAPEYPNGTQVLIKKVNEKEFIEWGKVYVLDTPNGAVIKKVRKTANPKVVECISINPEYQPFEVNTSFIRGWYRVLMSLSLK